MHSSKIVQNYTPELQAKLFSFFLYLFFKFFHTIFSEIFSSSIITGRFSLILSILPAFSFNTQHQFRPLNFGRCKQRKMRADDDCFMDHLDWKLGKLTGKEGVRITSHGVPTFFLWGIWCYPVDVVVILPKLQTQVHARGTFVELTGTPLPRITCFHTLDAVKGQQTITTDHGPH